ncbi:MAG: hypothetical protein IJB74_01305 [Clostridia bacterium]|nr:hypothetical protein [Clostridia bacterium]
MNTFSVDITNGLQSVLNLILQVFEYSFDFMRGIEFFGTNLLNFTVTIFLLGVVIPIVFTLVRSEAVSRYYIRESRNRRNRSNSSNGSKGE